MLIANNKIKRYWRETKPRRYQNKSSTWNPLERKLWKEYFRLQKWNGKKRRKKRDNIIKRYYSNVRKYVSNDILFAKGGLP